MRTILFFLLTATLAFTACESTSSYEVPTIADEFITFSIDGQEITLNAIDGTGQNDNRIRFYPSQDNSISISRTSSDRATRMRISGENLPLVKNGSEVSYVGEAYTPVTITVSGNSMSGSIYCPHVEDAEYVTYEGMLHIDGVSKSGKITGSFKTSPDVEGNPADIQNGTFQLGVDIND